MPPGAPAARSSRVSRPSRTATSTSATRRPCAWTSAWRSSSAASATCAWTTRTRRRSRTSIRREHQERHPLAWLPVVGRGRRQGAGLLQRVEHVRHDVPDRRGTHPTWPSLLLQPHAGRVEGIPRRAGEARTSLALARHGPRAQPAHLPRDARREVRGTPSATCASSARCATGSTRTASGASARRSTWPRRTSTSAIP